MENIILSKEFLGVLASVISLVGYIPYFRDLLKGKTRPHIFTWIIWTLIGCIVFIAQVVKGAGSGAWASGLTCIFCASIVVLTIRQGDRSITRSDWISFILALMAIPVWYIMRNPTLSVIITTIVYILTYYPTFRKSFTRPQDETIFLYVLSTLKSIFSIMATQSFSIATILSPVATIIMNTGFITMVMWRRKKICISLAKQPIEAIGQRDLPTV